LLTWWIVFVSANLVALDLTVEMSRIRTWDDVQSAVRSARYVEAASIVAAGLAIAVVLDITKLQESVGAHSIQAPDAPGPIEAGQP
jgi:hypothetical protein